MKKMALLLGILLVGVLLFACAPKEPPRPAAPAPAPQDKQIIKEGWEAQWEQVKKNAKKEGKVVLYNYGIQ